MKGKLNNLIVRYESELASLKVQRTHSEPRHTQIVMLEKFIADLRTLRG